MDRDDVSEDQLFPSRAQYPAIVGSTGLFPRNPVKYDDIEFVNGTSTDFPVSVTLTYKGRQYNPMVPVTLK
ncbi:Hypothetical protein NocV09_02000100 [Nannochloropsis oceanica]